jgi:import inner membrane translocase subunit TIM10B
MPVAGTPVDESNIHNLRDILSVYNKITESCFQRCASNFNQRHLTSIEEQCVENCGGKFVKGNHSIMSTFMELQTKKQQQMVDEATRQQQQQQQEQLQQLLQANAAASEAATPDDAAAVQT